MSTQNMGCLFYRNPLFLNENINASLEALSTLRPMRSVIALLADWMVIAAMIALFVLYPSIITALLAIIIIGIQQHALLVLMHEAAHYRLFPHKKWSTRVSDWLIAWPCLVSTQSYRDYHLQHHFKFNKDEDPDVMYFKQVGDWSFPKKMPKLLYLLLGSISEILTTISMTNQSNKKNRKLPIARIIYYLVALATLTYFNLWLYFLLFWLAPLLFVLPILLRFRFIGEHFALAGINDFNMSRNNTFPKWQAAIFMPHNIGYHVVHHFLPRIPFYHLPKAHSLLLQQAEYREQQEQCHNLSALLAKLTDCNSSAQAGYAGRTR